MNSCSYTGPDSDTLHREGENQGVNHVRKSDQESDEESDEGPAARSTRTRGKSPVDKVPAKRKVAAYGRRD